MNSGVLENENLRLTFLPTCGGKLASLYDKRSGHEWLWTNPHLPVCEPEYGVSYVEEADSGGWDEVFPSVDPCTLVLEDGASVAVPDHGDLVQLPWTVEQAEADRMAMSLRGRCLPFVFERTIVLKEQSLGFYYRVVNEGDQSFPWLWCAHPLIPLDDSLEVLLPERARFEVLAAVGDGGLVPGTRIRFDQLPLGAGKDFAVKLFSVRGSVDRVTLRHGCGASLRIDWDVAQVPHLGLWVNSNGWSGCGSVPYRNLGVEPAIRPVDNLSSDCDAPILGAGQAIEWSLSLSLNTETA